MMEKRKDRFTRPGQAAKDEEQMPGTRRRGELLEKEILQAAWDELNEVGYTRLTMEGVADRAKTNKTSVYRRWPRKSELVIATLHKHIVKPASDIPDTGELRKDLLLLLHRITQPMQAIGAETIHGLMVEHLGKEFFAQMPRIKHSGEKDKWNLMMTAILKNAELRGEVDMKRISPRVVSLPIDLLQYEFLTTYEPVSDEAVTEMIDDIFLPLVRQNR